MDALEQLQRWYAAQCDGDWEHQGGISIATLDNPGWTVAIDLADTALAAAPFAGHQRGEVGDGGWVLCRREGDRFVGSCGPLQLGELLDIFHRWARTAHPAGGN